MSSIKSKLSFYFTIVILPLIIVAIFTNTVANQILNEKANKTLESSLEQSDKYLSFILQKAKGIAFSLAMDKDISSIFNTTWDVVGYKGYTNYEKIRDKMRAITNINADIQSIYIISGSVGYMFTSHSGIYNLNDLDESYIDLIEKNQLSRQFTWLETHKDIDSLNVISFIADGNLIDTLASYDKAILVNIAESFIYDTIRNTDLAVGAKTFLIDDNGYIISSADKSEIGSRMNIDFLNKFKSETKGYIIDKAYNTEMIISYKRNADTGWYIMAMIPYNDFFRELIIFRRLFWYTIILTGLLLIAIINIVSIGVYNPIRHLIWAMEQVQKGILSTRIKKMRKDEFGYLYKSFNTMVDQLQKAIKELYEERLLVKENEIKALQAQIDPHFLYNTLDTISWMARRYKADDVSKMVLAMANFYRASLARGKEFISIAENVKQLDNYLTIQKMRYRDKLNYELYVDEELMDHMMLRLLLQPIVENAIYHGIEKKKNASKIEVIGKKVGNIAHFEIIDDGIGMDEKQLAALKREINAPNNGEMNYALKNINQRIKLFYGSEYGIEVESKLNEGTKVIIEFPLYEGVGISEHQYVNGIT